MTSDRDNTTIILTDLPLPSTTTTTNNDPDHDPHQLPAADTSYQAWLTLALCFILEGVIWSFPLSSGIFQAHFLTHPPFSHPTSSALLATIATLTSSTAYFLCPPMSLLYQRYPSFRRPGMICGLAFTVATLLAASFARDAGVLLVTLGLGYGVGSLGMYFPAIVVLDEWFVARKGMAFGVMWAGTGVAGAGVPVVLGWWIERFGWRGALRGWGCVVVVFCLPCVLLLKPRLPVSISAALRPRNLSFLRRLPFWLFAAGVAGWSFGYTLPPLWLPSFANDLHLPAFAGPLSLSLSNVAFSIGAIGFGIMVDRFHVSLSILITSVGLAFAAFIFWGLASGQAMLYIFAMLWGAFGGGFTTTWSGCAMLLRRLEPTGDLDINLIMALMATAKGFGSVVSGPLSARLLQAGWNYDKGHISSAYDSQYGPVVVFSGLSVMLGTTACIGRLFKVL